MEEVEKLNINSSVEFKLSQNDIIDVLVDEKLKSLLEDFKILSEYKDKYKVENLIINYCFELYPKLNEGFKYKSFNSKGNNMTGLKHLFIEDDKIIISSVSNYSNFGYSVTFNRRTDISNSVIEHEEILFTLNKTEHAELFENLLRNFEDLKSKVEEFLSKYEYLIKEENKYPKNFIELNHSKLAKIYKMQFTKRAMSENKVLKSFLTQKFLIHGEL